MKKIILIPPVYLLFCIVLDFILFFVFPKFNMILFPLDLSGSILIIGGLFLILWSGRLFEEVKTTATFGESTSLVVKGPYKITRNPIYLGLILILFGLSVCLGNIISFISPVILFVILNFMFIPFEEEKMAKSFGTDYVKYKKSVRRWL